MKISTAMRLSKSNPRESRIIHLNLPATKTKFIRWQDENCFKCHKYTDNPAKCCKKNIELNEHFFVDKQCSLDILQSNCPNFIRLTKKLVKKRTYLERKHLFNWQQIKSMFDSGLTISQISIRIDQSPQLVRYYLKKWGLR